MKKVIYIIVGIVIFAVLIGGGYKLMKHLQKTSSTAQPAMTQNSVSPTAVPTISVGLTNKADSSNQQLDQDLQNIQGSVNNLSADQTQENQAVSNQSADTPTEQ